MYIKIYIHLNFQRGICESCFENEAKPFLQSKVNWDTPTIQNVEWNQYLSCYKSLSNSEMKNTSRCIHYRFTFGKIMFDLKHRCSHCRVFPDTTADHDHCLIFINSRHKKHNESKPWSNDWTDYILLPNFAISSSIMSIIIIIMTFIQIFIPQLLTLFSLNAS